MTAQGLWVRLGAFWRQTHDKGQWNQTNKGAGKQEEGILIAEHGRLTEHLLIGLPHGDLTSRSGRGPPAHQELTDAVGEEVIAKAAWIGVGGKALLIYLRVSSEEGG